MPMKPTGFAGGLSPRCSADGHNTPAVRQGNEDPRERWCVLMNPDVEAYLAFTIQVVIQYGGAA